MPAVAGMRGTGSFSDDEAPTNFREAILREYPQGGAVFMMILGMLDSESVDSRKFTIFQQGLPQQRFIIASAAGGSDNSDDTAFTLSTTLPVANLYPGRSWKAGHIGRIETTGETFMVESGTDTVLTVYRGVGNSGTGELFTDGDACTIIGHADEEGDDTPAAIGYDPSTEYNYIETFRTAMDLTDDAAQEYYRTGDIMKNKKFDTSLIHSIEMEKAFLFGSRDEFTATGDVQNRRTTGGLFWFLGDPYGSGTTYLTDFSSTGFTKNGFQEFLRPIYTIQNTSQNKIALCGATCLGVINDYAEEHGHIVVEPRESTYGLQIRTLVHAWGELKLINHPLLSEHADWTSMMFVVDTKNVKYRYLRGRDTRFLRERQGNGEDRVKHEYMTKAGLELRHPRTHGIATGITTYIP